MKAKVILANWLLSFMGLCVDTERSAFLAVMVLFGWFCASQLILIYADRRGWMKQIVKRFKLDEL